MKKENGPNKETPIEDGSIRNPLDEILIESDIRLWQLQLELETPCKAEVLEQIHLLHDQIREVLTTVKKLKT